MMLTPRFTEDVVSASCSVVNFLQVELWFFVKMDEIKNSSKQQFDLKPSGVLRMKEDFIFD